jgi:hypothetical protein
LFDSRAYRFDGPDDLMTRNHGKFFESEISLDHVQIRAADSTGMHLYQNFIIGWLRNGNITQC